MYGIHGRDSYDQRKRTKQAVYQRQGRLLIEWNTTGPLPALTRPSLRPRPGT